MNPPITWVALLFALAIGCVLIVAISLWMVWSMWLDLSQLRIFVSDRTDGLMRKQIEALQEINGAAAQVTALKSELLRRDAHLGGA